MYGLLTDRALKGWTEVFLATTVLTSVTGFGFPAQHVTPAHVLGVLSLFVLAAALFAKYTRHLSGVWGPTYVVNAVTAFYLNVFVLIVQAFLKVPVLKSLAPTQSEPPFAVTQFVAFVAFVAIGTIATLKLRRKPLLVA